MLAVVGEGSSSGVKTDHVTVEVSLDMLGHHQVRLYRTFPPAALQKTQSMVLIIVRHVCGT